MMLHLHGLPLHSISMAPLLWNRDTAAVPELQGPGHKPARQELTSVKVLFWNQMLVSVCRQADALKHTVR
jgi:hypothetical protein